MPVLQPQVHRRALSRALAFVCAVALATGALWTGWHGDDTPAAWRTVLSDVDDDGQGDSVGRLIRAAHLRRDVDRDERFADRSTERFRTAPHTPPAILTAATALEVPSSWVAVVRSAAPPIVSRSIRTSSRGPPAPLSHAV
jgi:hypothetical protein